MALSIYDSHDDPHTAPAPPLTIHREDALALAACAVARERFPDLGFADPQAESVVAALDLDVAHFDETRLRQAVVRTMVIDRVVAEFVARHPSGLVVGLLPGLCTRFSRVDNGVVHWLELEPTASLAAFKRDLFTSRSPDGANCRHVIAQCCSIDCRGWMKLLHEASDMPVLLVGQNGFRRAPSDVRDRFFTNIARHLPTGTELVVDYDAEAPLRPASSRPEGASLAALDGFGAWVSYPRIRFVRGTDHSARLAHDLAGVNAVSRLFRGRGISSVAHFRLA